MISFSQPAYFAALAVILLIFLIHLLNKRNPKPIFFSSIQLFKHSESQKVKKIYFNEWLLFLIRSLIISLLVLILVDPRFQSDSATNLEKWILIDPKIDETLIKNELDSLEQNGFKKHYLVNGYPANLEKSRSEIENYWSLIDEAQQYADEINVYSNSHLQNFRLKRPKFTSKINWFHIPNRTQIAHEILSNRVKNNNYSWNIISSESNTRFKKAKAIETKNTLSTVKIDIYFSSNFKTDLKFIKAAIFAINQLGFQQLEIAEYKIEQFSSSNDADWILWLSDQSIQIDHKTNAKLLIYRNSDSTELISKHSNYFALNNRLIASLNKQVYSVDLPNILAELFLEFPNQAIQQNDKRILFYSQLMNNTSKTQNGLEKKQARTESASTFLWTLFFVLLAAERHYSVRRIR